MKNFYRFNLIVVFAIVIMGLIACRPGVPQTISSKPARAENDPAKEPIKTAVATTIKIQSSATPIPTQMPAKENPLVETQLRSVSFSSTEMSSSSTTLLPTKTSSQVKFSSPAVAKTPLLLPEIPIVYADTDIPVSDQAIDANNLSQLTQVAQWGNGDILAVAFSPDGEFFIVGSAVGFARYDSNNSHETAEWTSWEHPYFYESLFFSSDGDYLLLKDGSKSQIYSFVDQEFVADVDDVSWIKSSKRVGYRNNWAISPDGSKRFSSSSVADEDNFNVEIVVQEIYDNDTKELLLTLQDETVYVEYHHYNEPEGCDLTSFNMCGNAYDPIAMHPYRVAFSPTGETVSVLYRASGLWNSDQFSLLHVHSLDDGRTVARIGNFAQPVETFSYSPDGESLLVVYGNGSIQMWDMGPIQPAYKLWHFDSPIQNVSYSFDGRYLLVQRQGWIEKRPVRNGLLQARYQADAFALSPTANTIALGNEDGEIVIHDMISEQPIHTISAHEAQVYALAFSPDGNMLASSGEDCRVQSWGVDQGIHLYDFAENSTQPYDDITESESRVFVKDLAFVAGANQLIGYGSWARVVNWEIASGDTNYMIEPEPLDYYNGMITLKPHFPEFLSFTPNNQSFVLNYAEYDLETGESLGQYQPADSAPEGCMSVGPKTADGELMFTKGFDAREGQICILNTANGRLVETIEVIPAVANGHDPIGWLYLSPDGGQLLVSSYSGVLRVYQITKKLVAPRQEDLLQLLASH